MFVQKIGHSSIGHFNGDSVLVCMIYSTFTVSDLHPSYFLFLPNFMLFPLSAARWMITVISGSSAFSVIHSKTRAACHQNGNR